MLWQPERGREGCVDSLIIQGGNRLSGTIKISGAKNSALPIMAASLLSDDSISLGNLPHLADITTMNQLLMAMGATVEFADDHRRLQLRTDAVRSDGIMLEPLANTMRASFLVLGPLLARFGRARLSLPGGCAIGQRPVDMHLRALRALGASFELSDGQVIGRAAAGLHGARIRFDGPTVGGTENILMAAVLARGETRIENAACEPEVVDLARCLQAMGARIDGIGTSTVTVEGVDHLSACDYDLMPDRIETGTYLVAAAVTGGSVRLENARVDTIQAVMHHLEQTGAELTTGDRWVALDMGGQVPRAVDIETAPYPGFPTDMQAQFTAMNAIAKGPSRIVERIFEDRFIHIQYLRRMGADIEVVGNEARMRGGSVLHGARVAANDLRASASLVIAGLVASGETTIEHIYHIDRGYEWIEEKMSRLGAQIQRRPDALSPG